MFKKNEIGSCKVLNVYIASLSTEDDSDHSDTETTKKHALWVLAVRHSVALRDEGLREGSSRT